MAATFRPDRAGSGRLNGTTFAESAIGPVRGLSGTEKFDTDPSRWIQSACLPVLGLTRRLGVRNQPIIGRDGNEDASREADFLSAECGWRCLLAGRSSAARWPGQYAC